MDGDGIEDEARKSFREAIELCLRKIGIKGVTVTLGKQIGDKWHIQFSGPKKEVDHAKEIFGR